MNEAIVAQQPSRTGATGRCLDGGLPEIANPPREFRLAWLLAVGGLVGLVASATLLIEKVELLKNPDYVPSCSINPVLSCGSIMSTPQAEVFGFPNPILGVVGFAVVLTVGVSLLSGVHYPRHFWLGLQGGASLGGVFVHWLIFQSLYRIEALCPYCMIVWVVTIATFWYVTLHNLRRGDASQGSIGAGVARMAADFHAVILTGWGLVVAGLIAERFWDYWTTLLP